MKKIHTHFLECSTPDCAICKKLKPLTYIHAKHCTVVPGEQCVIPYCARAKMELQTLMAQRSQQRSVNGGMPQQMGMGGGMMGGGGMPGTMLGGLLPGMAGAGVPGMMGANGMGMPQGMMGGGMLGGSESTQARHAATPPHPAALAPSRLSRPLPPPSPLTPPPPSSPRRRRRSTSSCWRT